MFETASSVQMSRFQTGKLGKSLYNFSSEKVFDSRGGEVSWYYFCNLLIMSCLPQIYRSTPKFDNLKVANLENIDNLILNLIYVLGKIQLNMKVKMRFPTLS